LMKLLGGDMEQHRLCVVDYCEVPRTKLERAVDFMDSQIQRERSVDPPTPKKSHTDHWS